jgi:hypothetical protein
MKLSELLQDVTLISSLPEQLATLGCEYFGKDDGGNRYWIHPQVEGWIQVNNSSNGKMFRQYLSNPYYTSQARMHENERYEITAKSTMDNAYSV